MAGSLSEEDRLIRKLRKKLRQIEHLEGLDRELNDEEEAKVEKKDEIRRELKQIMKRKSATEEAAVASPKKTKGSSESLEQEEQLEIR